MGKKYAVLNDSIFKANRDKDIANLEIAHYTKQKETENLLLKAEQKNQAAQLKRQTLIASISIVGLLLLNFFAFQLFRARKKLEYMNNNLEEKVEERTSELEDTNKNLRQSNEELERFAYIASHDLKEPLRSMGSFISLIKHNLVAKKYDQLEEYFSFIEESNYQMVDLVDSILAFSKLKSQQNEEEKIINLNEEIQEVSALFDKVRKYKSAIIEYDNLPHIYYQPNKLKIILRNIIENGIKYNDNTMPKVSISHQIEEDRFKLIIADNGIGINEEFHEKIFDMFVRLHNRLDYNGSGMGLAFCKKLLENSEESIEVESKVGEGSTFTITLNTKVATYSQQELTV